MRELSQNILVVMLQDPTGPGYLLGKRVLDLKIGPGVGIEN